MLFYNVENERLTLYDVTSAFPHGIPRVLLLTVVQT